MPSLPLQRIHTVCKWSTMTLGTLCLLLIAFAFVTPDGRFLGLIIEQHEPPMPWKIFGAEDVLRGVIAPESTNIVFHMPLGVDSIPIKDFLGHKGKDVRFWGYCFEQNYDPKITERREGLPGLIFLSQKERAIREKLRPSIQEPTFSPTRLPTREEVERKRRIDTIHHQLEVLSEGMLCYLMTEQSLPLGLDPDGDGLNDQLEHEIGTVPESPDSDGDGLWDGVEYLTRTNPLLRDGDSDGLIDGIEDKNWNGRQDPGETDPRTWDSDRDGLCDGICRVKLGNGRHVFLGEDLNLNGKLDTGAKETDPLKKDTDGSGLYDYEERIRCFEKPSSTGCK